MQVWLRYGLVLKLFSDLLIGQELKTDSFVQKAVGWFSRDVFAHRKLQNACWLLFDQTVQLYNS